MPSFTSIETNLPLLRRYARTLTASQGIGDAYVRATLEALIEEPHLLIDDVSQRVALYRLFHCVWQAAGDVEPPVWLPQRSSSEVGAADERLTSLTPQSRQVLLLSAMEEFSRAEIASILNIPRERVDGLLKDAELELAEIISAHVLIIEDEPAIALDIASSVEEIGHQVTAVAKTRDEALASAKSNPPDIILADIQLADGSSGVDAAIDILRQLELPVIFITAFPERVLTGTRLEPRFVVTKPFVLATLRAAMGQALFFRRNTKSLAH